MAKRVPNVHGSKVYNLTSGATLPAWISDRKKRELAKDVDFRRRIELVQDLEFPTSCQRIEMSPDGGYLVSTGGYPPAVKVYELSELSLKFERRLDSEIIDFRILSEDYSKLVFLQANRHVEFHAAYGRHFSIRVPTFGRSLAYHAPSCELLVAAAGDEIYRLDLAEGVFKAPLPLPSKGFGSTQLKISPVHGLIAAACESGEVAFFDPRTKGGKSLTSLDIIPGLASNTYISSAGDVNSAKLAEAMPSCLEFDSHDGVTFAVGTTSGHVMLYDLRSAQPLCVKQHQNGLAIRKVSFHNGDGTEQPIRRVLSADEKVIKVWDRDIAVQ
jgi:ribosome biogenesis protein ENP2